MYKVEVETLEELNVIEKSLEEYKRRVKEDDKAEEFLKSKKFKMGDYVIKKGTTYFDNVFNSKEGDIGKIVDWDFANKYYRVYFDSNQPYQGVKEERLEKYKGEVSSDLYIKDPREIQSIFVDLK